MNIPEEVEAAFNSDEGVSSFSTVSALRDALEIMFETRVARQLESKNDIPNTEEGPSLDSCSKSTQEEGNAIHVAYSNGLLAGANIDHRSEFLQSVIEFSETTASLTTPFYEFNPTDGNACRSNFLEIEKVFLENRVDFDSNKAELSELYEDILEAMKNAIPRYVMINNFEFICWAATYIAPYTGPEDSNENEQTVTTTSDNTQEASDTTASKISGTREVCSALKMDTNTNGVPDILEPISDNASSSTSDTSADNKP